MTSRHKKMCRNKLTLSSGTLMFRLTETFSKRRTRGSTLEASVMALKTTLYTRFRLCARSSDLRTRLHARGSTLKPSPVACARLDPRTISCCCKGR